MQAALTGITIVDNLGRRINSPGNQAHRVRIRLQQHVPVHRAHQLIMDSRIIPGHSLDQDGFRQPAVFLDEFIGGDELTARITGHVRHQAFHLGNPVFSQPVPDSFH